MRDSDGIIVSTPEYARGDPGAFKNALDWLVPTDAFVAAIDNRSWSNGCIHRLDPIRAALRLSRAAVAESASG